MRNDVSQLKNPFRFELRSRFVAALRVQHERPLERTVLVESLSSRAAPREAVRAGGRDALEGVVERGEDVPLRVRAPGARGERRERVDDAFLELAIAFALPERVGERDEEILERRVGRVAPAGDAVRRGRGLAYRTVRR